MNAFLRYCLPALLITGCQMCAGPVHDQLNATKALVAPVIDGKGNDSCWAKAAIYPIDQLWSGKLPHASDFMGRFRICWDSSYLYILAEVYDDSLMKLEPAPARPAGEQDGFDVFALHDTPEEITLNPDSSFVDHFSLVVRLALPGAGNSGTKQEEPVALAVTTVQQLSTWEFALKISPDKNEDHRQLGPDQILGFAIAYNDHDRSKRMESRMGSMPLQPDPARKTGNPRRVDLSQLHLLPQEN